MIYKKDKKARYSVVYVENMTKKEINYICLQKI